MQAQFNRGDFRGLQKRSLRALKKHPEHAILHGFAGASYAGLGNLDRAISHYKRAIHLKDDMPVFYNDLGVLYLQSSEFRHATLSFQKAIECGQDDAAIWYRLGLSLQGEGRLREAFVQFSNALSKAPTEPIYASALGNAFEKGGFFNEAIGSFRVAKMLEPENPIHDLAISRCLYGQGEGKAALEAIEPATIKHPDKAVLHNLHMAILGSLGEFKKSQNAGRRAVQCPDATAAHFYNFVLYHDMNSEGEISKVIHEKLNDASDLQDLRALHFAMAKVSEDNDDLSSAYNHFLAANKAQKQATGYNFRSDAAVFSQISQSFLSAQQPPISDEHLGPTPIFILGMPRSGTTLTEAILARHPEVEPVGETSALLQATLVSGAGGRLPTPEQIDFIRQDYISRLPDRATSASYFTDKMPLNFRLIGYIAMAFPEAKIIHCRRDAKAVCWSNFKTSFQDALSYACDPNDIVNYYQMYERLMSFWHKRFPNFIYDFTYEALTGQPEQNIRILLETLGLDWNEDCLSPEQSSQMINTASQKQARQKIYTGSSDSWRKYEAYAGDWLQKLETPPVGP